MKRAAWLLVVFLCSCTRQETQPTVAETVDIFEGSYYPCHGPKIEKGEIPELIRKENIDWYAGDCAQLGDPKLEQVKTLMTKGWRVMAIDARGTSENWREELKTDQEERAALEHGEKLANEFKDALEAPYKIEFVHGVLDHGSHIWEANPEIVVHINKRMGQEQALFLQTPSPKEVLGYLKKGWSVERITVMGANTEDKLCPLLATLAKKVKRLSIDYMPQVETQRLEVELRWPRDKRQQ